MPNGGMSFIIKMMQFVTNLVTNLKCLLTSEWYRGNIMYIYLLIRNP